jgi:hypothetical protein
MAAAAADVAASMLMTAAAHCRTNQLLLEPVEAVDLNLLLRPQSSASSATRFVYSCRIKLGPQGCPPDWLQILLSAVCQAVGLDGVVVLSKLLDATCDTLGSYKFVFVVS